MYNTGYELIIAGIAAAMSAQLMKFIGYTIRFKKLNFSVLFTTGGMPSSHSAGVCSMATSAGLIRGFDSVEFAIAVGLALVVMYDAAGIRRAAGKMAVTLNKLMEDMYSNNKQEVGEKLKELLGHTPFEVFVGSIWGIFSAWAIHLYIL